MPDPVSRPSLIAPLPANAVLAVIAGRGNYPQRTIAGARRAGVSVKLLQLHGETAPETTAMVLPGDSAMVKVGQIGKLLKRLGEFSATHAVMVGQVAPGRLFRGLHPDFRALRLLSRIRIRNAATLFSAVVEAIEQNGQAVLDARAFVEDDLATEGEIVTRHRRADHATISYGLAVARRMAELDTGQCLVVRKGTVLSLEGFDGTDGLIEYAGRFPPKGKILIKLAKQNHDFRFDVPCVGTRTIEKLAANGFSHLVVEADRVLLLDKPAVLESAREKRISILGVC